jgi:hypothetical protein
MSFDVSRIPTTTDRPADAGPSSALRELPKANAGRRTVLRGIALSGVTVGAAALSWAQFGRQESARAEDGPNGLRGWDRNDCRDAYPDGYREERDNGGRYRDAEGACFGGDFMGSHLCGNGWHRADTAQNSSGQTFVFAPISTACGTTETKNSWKWKTSDGRVWRCSDGTTTVSVDGEDRTFLSICRAEVPQ